MSENCELCTCKTANYPFVCPHWKREMNVHTHAICAGTFRPSERGKYVAFWNHEKNQPNAHGDGVSVPQKRPEELPPRLTIGMATAHDFDGVYFTIQSLRIHHADVMPFIEIVVVDNAPDSPHSEPIKGLLGKVPRGRYIAMSEPRGTAAPRDRIFREASADAVLCVDSHVLLWPDSVRRLINWFSEHPECSDLLQGPMMDDQIGAVHATHMDPVWRSEMFGIWGNDPRGHDFNAPPFEIPMHGLGLFACRKDAWLGFSEHFRGFGGEEGYIHEKFRQSGNRTLCLPFLRWLHRFARPAGVPYALTVNDKLRNYLIGWTELGLDVGPVVEHFKDKLPPLQMVAAVTDVRRLNITPRPKATPVDAAFVAAVRAPSDINEHLPLLRKLASEVETVVEMGVRCGVSTRAFLAARPKRMVSIDVNPAPPELTALASGLPWEFRRDSSLTAEPIDCDLLFIDTLHTAEQLRRELERHAARVRRYIVLHDTETFGLHGEGGGDGLLKAVSEFLQAHPAEWDIHIHRKNNNGLTVLKRWNVETDASRGLGDTVAKAAHAIGLDRLAKSVAKWFGADCGCAGRQAVLNQWFSFGKS